MFGKRPGAGSSQGLSAVRPAEPIPSSAPAVPVLSEAAPARSAAPEPAAAEPTPFVVAAEKRKSEEYYQTKGMIFGALIEAIDLAQLSRLEGDAAREEIRDIVNEIIGLKNVVMSIAEQEELLDDICNDVLGYGPLEPLLARDDIADVMVNGANKTYIEEHLPADREPGRPPRR
jgi:pilus assembly protein CpaF